MRLGVALGLALLVVAGCRSVASPAAPTTRGGITDGTWRVGADIAPGTYRALGVEGRDCFWERLSGFTGELDDVIANGLDAPPVVVTILASDKGFTTAHCGTWQRQ